MDAAAALAPADADVKVFTFNSDNQALGHFVLDYRLILLGGGLGSGKTTLHGLNLHVRAEHETDQLGGIFTNTQNTLEKGVFTEIGKIFRMLGLEQPCYDKRPPRSWFRRWAREGIEIPTLARYRNVLTTPEGVHVLCGTLHHQSFHQYETIQFGWIRLEEVINNSLEAVDTMTERVRCLTGGDSNPDCARWHHHAAHWIFNPPRGKHPWLYAKLHQLEDAARKIYHPLRDGETCPGCVYVTPDGHEVARVHGPELNHRKWPLLRQGIGDAIWIRSRTDDNAKNQNRGYRDGLASNMSKGTAARRLDGDIIEETEGRAYEAWSSENIHPVGYDADRTLYLTMDFNLAPRAAGFWHPLNPGEYPSEHEREGITHIGKFGEFFYAGEMSDRKFALALIRGDRGDGFDVQPRYRSEELRGLPPSCHRCDEDCENPCRLKCSKICRAGHWNGLKGHRGRIIAYGDQRGSHRSSHSDNLESSWQIVIEELQKLDSFGIDVPDVQPSPRARVDAVNAKLCNSFDVRSAWFDPRCEESMRDLDQVQWDDTGMKLREWRWGSQGTEAHRTHLLDGDGYFIVQMFPSGNDIDPESEIPTITRKRPRRVRGISHLRD